MKKIVLLCAVFCAAATYTFAQTADSQTTQTDAPHFRGGLNRENTMKSLGLNSDQEAKIKDLNKVYMDKMKDLSTQRDADMKTILTPEQYTKYTASKAKRQEDWKNGGHHGEKIKENLGLSSDQDTKVKDLNKGFREKMKAIWTDKTLTKDQSKAKMKDLSTQHDADMKAILTPDQYAKYTADQTKWKTNMQEHKTRN